jgi:gamma-glutamylcyclotransferase (GGCT)/AIG2-like uncharacterized protein YtfP
MSECRLLFIYGTLLDGHQPPQMQSVCRRLCRVAPATVQGFLYDLGPYPAVTVCGTTSRILGEIVEIDCDQTWHALDRYEGCPRQGEGDGLYSRVRTTATLKSGESVDCWIYVYNCDLSRAKVIESGCWRTHRGLL